MDFKHFYGHYKAILKILLKVDCKYFIVLHLQILGTVLYVFHFHCHYYYVAVQCGGRKIFKECNTKCRKTCENVHQKSNCVQTICMSGCFCPEGTVLHEEKCIPVGDCPCTHNNKGYKKGDTIKKDCNTW